MYVMYNNRMKEPLPLQVSMAEFRDNLAAYLDLVERGGTVTITRHGKPSAELKAIGDGEAIDEAIDIAGLETFRTSLNVRVEESPILKARQDERY